MKNLISSKNSKSELIVELIHTRAMLEKIAKWDFPYDSYQWHWGFDGVKEYFQSVAKHGLDRNSPIYIHKEPNVIENLKTFGFNKKVAESKG